MTSSTTQLSYKPAKVWWAIRTKPPTSKIRLIKISHRQNITPFNHDFMAGHTYQTVNRPKSGGSVYEGPAYASSVYGGSTYGGFAQRSALKTAYGGSAYKGSAYKGSTYRASLCRAFVRRAVVQSLVHEPCVE